MLKVFQSPKDLKTIFTLSLVLAFVLGLAACGSSQNADNLNESEIDNADADIMPQDNGTANLPTVSFKPTSSTTTGTNSFNSDASGKAPLIESLVEGTGYISVPVIVSTRRILRVKFIPGIQNKAVSGTGFYAKYSGLGVFLKVGATETDTGFLGNGDSAGFPRQASRIIDFSNSFTKTCPDSQPNCRQQVAITVSKPNYDFLCYSLSACVPPGYSRVDSVHPWNGTLFIETDDTVKMIEGVE